MYGGSEEQDDTGCGVSEPAQLAGEGLCGLRPALHLAQEVRGPCWGWR